MIEKACFPPGVINVISGHGNPAGAALSSHMKVRCTSFTGSPLTGQKIQAAAAKSNLKHVLMELGGKSPAVVFEEADLEAAAAQTQFSIQFNSGQVCVTNSRIYVHEAVAEKFSKLFREKSEAVQLGDPTTSHGPQIDLLHNTLWNRDFFFVPDGCSINITAIFPCFTQILFYCLLNQVGAIVVVLHFWELIVPQTYTVPGPYRNMSGTVDQP
jgi:hypothetical protein